MARINNSTSTYGHVASVQLRFSKAPEGWGEDVAADLYLEAGSSEIEYAQLLNYLSARVSQTALIGQLVALATHIDNLMRSTRLDVVMREIDSINEVSSLGVVAEAEYVVGNTGHGPTGNSNTRLLIK